MKNGCEGGATSVKKDRLGHNSEVSRSLEMAKKKLYDSLMLRDPLITQDSLPANSNSFYRRNLFLWGVFSF